MLQKGSSTFIRAVFRLLSTGIRKAATFFSTRQMRANVSDLGLSKLAIDGASHVSSIVRGTGSRVTSHETSLLARCRRVYAHAHDYHINSISNSSDGETFISPDDLRINLWNLEISSQSFNIVYVKPANMKDLTEVITSAVPKAQSVSLIRGNQLCAVLEQNCYVSN